ncbi:four helix bundle protein [Candidatus Daviesbacteria bacterium]|nr:four helix bundle protein [Candidatus Daviesbacteria bacterium]
MDQALEHHKGDKGNMEDMEINQKQNQKKKAGYEYLLAYKLTVPIYDLTMEFVKKYIPYKSRTVDQMEQAARSGMQNIPEGYKQQSLAGYIKLSGVSRGSLEELLNDYLSYARQNKIEIWDKERAKREIREIGVIWEIIKNNPYLPSQPNFPSLPSDSTRAVNLLITLIQQANFLIDKLIQSLKEKHTKEGGFNENLLKKRLEQRGKAWQKGFIKLTKKTLTTYLIIFFALSGSGLLYLFGPWTKSTQAVWFNDDWAYRQEVPVTSTNGSAQSNVFISFSLDTATLITAGKLQSSCQDIRITDQGGKNLPYYIGRTNACNLSNTTVDFLLTSFPDLKSTYYVYYGNPAVSSKDVGAFSQSQASNYSVGSLGSEAKAPSPTLYWKFDDPAISSVIQDSTTNNLDGTLNNNPTWQTEDMCISGKCYYFSGTANMNVSKADDAKLDFAATDNFTVSTWVKRNGASSAINYIMSKADTTTGGYKLWMDADGDLCFGIDDDSSWGPDISTCSANANFDDDKWHFVSGVRSNTDDKVYVYVDGIQKDSQTDPTTATLANTNIFYVGVDRDGTSNEWLGFIDEVKVYPYARSATQVLADFNARGNNEGASTVIASDPRSNLSNGLVGYWKMDESSWTSDCTTEEVTDASGNSNNGESCPNADANDPLTGKFGNAGDFDGTNDYVNIDDNDGLTPSRVTVAAWLYRGRTVTAEMAINKGDGSTNANSSYELGFRSANNFPIFEVSTGSAWVTATGTTAISTSTWAHVVGTYDGKEVRIFVNGVLEESSSTTTSVVNDTNALRIGSTSGGFNFQGRVDEVRVYNRAISPAEVSQLYNFAPGPVGYWKMEEPSWNGTSGEVKDSSGNGINGTSTSATVTIGKYGKAGSFDGSSAFIAGSDSTFPSGSKPRTIEAWFYANSLPSNNVQATIFRYGTEGTDNGANGLQLVNDAGTQKIRYFGWNNDFDVTNTVSTKTWYHLAGVFNGSTTIQLYLNGVLVGQNTSFTAFNTVLNSFRIGSLVGSSFFNGKIDEVKIYNYVRTSAQIIEDMNAGHPAPGSPVGTPLGHWKFEQGADNTCSGGTNDACNSGSQGSALDGAQSGMAVPATSTSGWTNSGKFGKALIFDGTNDYVAMPSDVAALKITGDLTLSAWVNLADTSSTHDIICKYTGTAATSAYCLYIDTGIGGVYLNMSVVNSTGPSIITTTGTTKLSASTWYHVAGVFSSANSVKLYINGVQDASNTTSIPTTLQNPTTILDIGAENAGSNLFAGTIDEPKVYNQALTAEQVKLDMNRSSSQVLGALSDNSSYQVQAANQEYCVPGDSTSCAEPLLRYDFEEKANSGSAYDTSGNGYAGTITNTPTVVVGKIGGALKFNGNTTYVNVPTTATVKNQTAVTIEAWVKPNTIPGSGDREIYEEQNAGGSAPRIGLQIDGGLRCSAGNFSFVFDTANNGVDATLCSTTVAAGDSWYHIVGVYDSVNDSHKLYVNGKLEDTDTTAVGTIANTNPAFIAVATYDITSGSTFDGTIDGLKEFTYARTPAQIAWDYNRGAPVAHWKMDECQGTTINDSSGNSYPGTITLGSGGTTTVGTCSTSTSAWGGASGSNSGKRNYSLNFDGNDDYVDLGSFSVKGLSQYTISGWMNITALGNSSLYYEPVADVASFIRAQVWMDNLGTVCTANHFAFSFRTGTSGSSRRNVCATSTTAATGTWYHMAAVFDSDADVHYIYVNGVQEGSLSQAESAVANTSPNVNAKLGNSQSNQQPLNGQIDDARIYNYALTATQIKALYNDGGAARYGPVTGAP